MRLVIACIAFLFTHPLLLLLPLLLLFDAALQAQQLWDALQSAQEALQHSNQLHEMRTEALRALLKRQSRMALQPEAQALQWAVLAAWQRQTARQVRLRHWARCFQSFLMSC
jgi:hypothetical protein